MQVKITGEWEWHDDMFWTCETGLNTADTRKQTSLVRKTTITS
jgi:hypothetical protein